MSRIRELSIFMSGSTIIIIFVRFLNSRNSRQLKSLEYYQIYSIAHQHNAVSMFGWRLRRWPSIETQLWFVFAGLADCGCPLGRQRASVTPTPAPACQSDLLFPGNYLNAVPAAGAATDLHNQYGTVHSLGVFSAKPGLHWTLVALP